MMGKRSAMIGALVVAVVLVIGGVLVCFGDSKDRKVVIDENGKKVVKIDDWKYDEKMMVDSDGLRGWLSGGFLTNSSAGMAMESASVAFDSVAASPNMATGNIGFSVGGAKDINNFRENVENGYFPISTDITYNGLFYDYYFDTGMKGDSEDLFSPSYSTAVSKDPISGANEYFMTVGLNSNIKESDFARKKLNLVVVLDISGSMSSGLGRYYYDDPFYKEGSDVESKSKMVAANESVNVLIDQLKGDDRFGMVLFDDGAYVAKELSLVNETDMEAIKGHILEIGARGGTNFEAGYTSATKLFEDLKGVNSDEYENRIIVITDAMPNYGTTSKDGLFKFVEENAAEGIYTTFIGVGVDFNTNLIEMISNVKGANYYSVHTVSEFEKRMGEQFEYMVTPLVFDLELSMESEDYEIAGVYGSDTVNKENGNIMSVNTLFPSKSEGGEVKGGVVLLKLRKTGIGASEGVAKNGKITLSVAYKDRNGVAHENSQDVVFNERAGLGMETDFGANYGEYYENTGIRKAIVLTRYANALKNWILYERTEEDERFVIVPMTGIRDCNCTVEEVRVLLGEHERTSVKLTVSDEYKKVFEDLKKYLEAEIVEIGDETMRQEVEVLEKLI